VISPAKIQRRWVEISFITFRLAGFAALVFLVLPPEKAFAFLGVQLGVFGLYMGSSFAPNHIGMPLVSPKLKLDFLRRQVLMSRNISGGSLISVFMGGLNYQIETTCSPPWRDPIYVKRSRSFPHTALPKVSRTPAPRSGSPTASSSAISTPSDYAARTRSSARSSLNAAPSSQNSAPLRSKANGVAKAS
jgi:hypothetical protein